MEPEEFFEKVNRPMEDKLRETKKILKKYRKKSCIPCSGGKDSMILVILNAWMKLKIPTIHFDSEVEFPETYKYIEVIREKFKIENFHQIKKSFWKMPKDVRLLPSKNFNRICVHILKISLSNRFCRKHNLNYQIIGNRWDEGRRMYQAYHFGHVWEDSQFTKIFPIIWWNTNQVFEFYEKFNLPQNSNYKKGYDRQGCFTCPWLSDELLKKNHPKLFKLKEKAKLMFPQLYNDVNFCRKHNLNYQVIGNR